MVNPHHVAHWYPTAAYLYILWLDALALAWQRAALFERRRRIDHRPGVVHHDVGQPDAVAGRVGVGGEGDGAARRKVGGLVARQRVQQPGPADIGEQRIGDHLGVDVGSAHMSWIDTPLVQDAKSDLSAFREMLSKLPPPLNRTTTVDACGAAFVKGIEGRKKRIYCPGWVGAFRWIRPFVTTPLAERDILKFTPALLPKLDAEAAALGRSTASKRPRAKPSHPSPRSARTRRCASRRRPRTSSVRAGAPPGRFDARRVGQRVGHLATWSSFAIRYCPSSRTIRARSR